MNIENMYPLSPTQHGMIFHTLEDPAGDAYFIQASIGLQGKLDAALFAKAWERLLARHAALRTSFHWDGLDQPLQVVHQAVSLPLEFLDWRDVLVEQRSERLATWLAEDRQRPFELTNAPLFRLTLIDYGADQYQVVWSLHHLLVDGWSVSLLFQEVFGHLLGAPAATTPPPNVARYIAWLERQDMAAAEQFWRTTLSGITAPTALVIEQPDCAEPHRAIVDLTQRCEAALGAELQALAQRERITLSTIIHAAWALALCAYSGHDDVLFGSVSSGRSPTLPDSERMIGMLLTTLPVRVTCPSDLSVREWLTQLQHQMVERRQFEYTPLVEIQGWSDVPRGVPLFESLLVFENYPLDDLLRGGSQALRTTDVTFITPTNYPLTMQVMFTPDLTLNLSYDTSRFSAPTAQRIVAHLQTLLHAISEHIDGQLSDLVMIPPAEAALLEQFSYAPPLPALNRSVGSFIADHAAQRPSSIALRAGSTTVTYAELACRTNQIARYFLASGLPTGTPIGVFAERDTTMPMILLACLQSGYAYTPLNPIYPDERLSQILADSQCGIIATTREFAERITALTATLPQAPMIMVWDAALPELDAQASDPLPERIPDQTIATIFYTSGSTGTPKGAMVESLGVLNHLWAKINVLNMNETSRVAHTAAHSFDISVWQFLAALVVGGETVIYPTELVLTPLALFQAMQADGITISETVPTLLEALLTAVEQDADHGLRLPALAYLISNAELLPVPLVQRWFAAFPQVALLNTYGATECSDDTSHIVMTAPLPERTQRVPVGSPIAGFAILIVDQQLRPVPIGCPGQIVMCGVGVGQGYLGDRLKTERAFVNNPFAWYPESRLYLTGDLGRWREDGQLDFLGRTDGQVKLRGHRIELGEIDAALARCSGVRHCVTLIRPDPNHQPQLLSYIVGNAESRHVRQELLQRLPPFMIPDHIIALESMPLNPNGKIDRKALPEPDWGRVTSTDEALQTPMEELVAGIWCEVLKLTQVGRHANFFACGGHSLLATQLIARFRHTLAVDLPLRAVFEYPTIAELSAQIAQLRQAPLPPIEALPRENAMPVSFAQQRLWITNQFAKEQPLYSMPAVLRLNGSLNIAALEAALTALVARHESLRTQIKTVDGEPMQIINPPTPLPLKIIDVRDLDESTQTDIATSQIQRLITLPFDLEAGPLIRAHLVRLDDHAHVLTLALHHIITDGWSTSVLIRDLVALYHAITTNTTAGLPPLNIQYADYAVWQRSWFQGELLEHQEAYWRKQLADAPTLLSLPTDHPRPPVQSFRGALHTATLPATLVTQLQALSRECGATLFMTLLTGYQSLLSFYSGQHDILVGVPIAGRNRPGLDDLIGFFVNTLVLRTSVDRRISVRKLLTRVRETTLDAYANQDVPFEHLVELLKPERTLSHTPIYQVAFALQNTPEYQIGSDTLAIELVQEGDLGVAKFDLFVSLREVADGTLNAVVEYSTDLFDATTIQRFLEHYERLLWAMVTAPDQAVGAISILDADERHVVLHALNQTQQPYSLAPIIEQITEQARLKPAAPAICVGDVRINYHELITTVQQLSHALHARGVKRGDRVGIFQHRSIDLIPMLLAVQAAGAAYVPLDPTYPDDRLMVMVDDAGLCMIIADSSLMNRLPTTVPWVDLQALKAERELASDTPLGISLTPDDLAYVIYTSGSTGRPKGIAVPHRGLAAFMGWVKQQLDHRDFEGVMASTSVCFDLSVFEFFAPLIVGGTVILVENGLHIPAASHQPPVTMINVVPSVMNEILQQDKLPSTVRTVNLGGEAVPLHLVNQTYARTTVANVYNMYGPTEDTVYSLWCRLVPDATVVIGRPILNTQAYVVDELLRPVPIGVTGRLYLAGDGQAWGYLGKPEHTAQAFIPNPFGTTAGSRLYDTGDLARLRADHSIEYLGRVDFQIKIRGFRVELGEIETILLRHPAIAQVVVAAHQHREIGTQLVAYLVPEPHQSVAVAELRSYAQRWLPDYMVPAAFVVLEQLPLTLNGKVDRKQLPVPDETSLLHEPYVAPRTTTEATVSALWSQLLGVTTVGVNDNFFLLGGHSLLATQLLAQIRSQFGVEVDLRTFFEAPTVAELAHHIDDLQTVINAETDAMLLDQIDDLSDEEVAALLARLSLSS